MKRLLFFCSFFLLLIAGISRVNAQCLVNSICINTAFDPATYSSISAGTASSPARDPRWIVAGYTSSISGAATVGSLSYIIPTVTGAWVANPSTSPGGWISVINATGYWTYGTGVAYNMTLGRPFRTCTDDSITFTLHIANDNYMTLLAVDVTDSLSFYQAPPGAASDFNTYSSFTQTIFLPAGTHILTAKVNNYDDNLYNPTGLNIYGTISSKTGLPSIVYDADTSCNTYACGIPAAVCNTTALADSVKGCFGTTASLTTTIAGPDSVVKVRWSPTAGLSDSTVLNPTLTFGATSGYYTVTVNSILPHNFIVNGSFDLTNSGFINDYLWVTSGITAGHFGIGTNPSAYSGSMAAIGDHNTGTGKMLIVDGHTSAGMAFWKESIRVTPGSYYDLSTWVALLQSTSPPNIAFSINGTTLGTTFTPTTVGTWVNVLNTWYSGTDTVAYISMVDLNTVSTGNDFAIDDISFRRHCIVKDSIYVRTIPVDTTYTSAKLIACDSAGSVPVTAPGGFATYLWSNGGTTATIAVTASGPYIAYCTTGCKTLVDSNYVTLIPYDLAYNTRDTFLCFPATFELIAPQGFHSYTWQDGSIGATYKITSTGDYWVNSIGSCANHTDTIHAKYTDLTISLGLDTTVCMNYIIQSDEKDPNASYTWQDGSHNKTYSASHTGTYYATVKLGACVASDTVKVTFYHYFQNLPDTFLCKGTPFEILLTATPPEGGTVLWDNGSVNTVRPVTDSGTYWVYIKKGDCEILDTARVVTGYCDCWYDMPTAFTPNADGLNDMIRPKIQPGCDVAGYIFSVYNRWGELVFSSDFPGKGWDGVYKGVPADMGVYTYMLEFYSGVYSKKIHTSGTVTLIR